jgi:hypothetical protein
MTTIRDLQLKQKRALAQKKDNRQPFRAVICDEEGNFSGSGSIWANQNKHLVWFMPFGNAQPAQVRCVRLEPQIGLGVLIGYADGSNEQEVLSDDPFLRQAGDNTNAYLSVSGRDFEPGGRLQMWLYPKAFVPLCIYPGSALTINVVAGDYEDYQGVRQTFAGIEAYDISGSQPAGPNEHLLVGIYIDTSNTIGTVDGTAVATTVAAPEPSWPAGSMRLGTVELDDTQTTINFANDIDNRRLFYPYPGSGAILKTFVDAKGDLITATADDTPAILSVGTDGYILAADSGEATGLKWITSPVGVTGEVWLIRGQTVTIYATITLALAAAASGDTIVLWNDTYSEEIEIDTDIVLCCISQNSVIIADVSSSGITVDLTTTASVLDGLSITNDDDDGWPLRVQAGAGGSIIRNCTLIADGGGTTHNGVYAVDDCVIEHCTITISGATNNYCVNNAAGTTEIIGGTLIGDVNNDDIMILRGPTITGTITNAGTITGWYLDSSENIITVGTSDLLGEGSNYPDIGSTTAAQKFGNIYQGTAKDIYPQASTNGLNARFERLFGDDVPVDTYKLTQRNFIVNSGADQLGFQDSQANPYNLTGTNFSVSAPGSGYQFNSATSAHWLFFACTDGTTPLYMDWTSTAKNYYNGMIWFGSPPWTSDKYLFELRLWDTTTPGAADDYYGWRIDWLGSTYPQWPLRFQSVRGTGVTFPDGSATLLGASAPLPLHPFSFQTRIYGTHQFYQQLVEAESPYPFYELNDSTGSISQFQYARFYAPAYTGANGYGLCMIDQIRVV